MEKNIPTYKANKVLNNYNQKTLKDLSDSRHRLYAAAENLLKYENRTDLTTQEQDLLNKAKNIRDQVKNISGISIDQVSTQPDGKVMFTGLSKIRDMYPKATFEVSKSGDSTFKEYKIVAQVANIDTAKLLIVDNDGNVTNYKSSITGAEGYKAMLMDNLYTNKRFFKITNSQGQETYISDVQPKILFDLADKKDDVVKEEQQEQLLEEYKEEKTY